MNDDKYARTGDGFYVNRTDQIVKDLEMMKENANTLSDEVTFQRERYGRLEAKYNSAMMALEKIIEIANDRL